MVQLASGESSPLIQMSFLGRPCKQTASVVLTNLSLGSSRAPPPPTSLEAILSPSPSTASDDSSTDFRLQYLQNWTTVTSDSTLLASLIVSWTTCEYNYYHYIDRDAFLDDVAGGGTEFCSPLLVNALLASACVCID